MKPYIIIASLLIWSSINIVINVGLGKWPDFSIIEHTKASENEIILIKDVLKIKNKYAIIGQTTLLIYLCFLLEFIVVTVRDFRWKQALARTLFIVAILIFISSIIRLGMEYELTRNFFYVKYEHISRGKMLIDFIYDKARVSFFVYLGYLAAISFLYYKAECARLRK